MKKLLEKIKTLFDKFKSKSKKIKIISSLALVSVIIAIIISVMHVSSNKYAILFSDLDANDAKNVVEYLTKQKVDSKLDSSTNTILVPKSEVDRLKLELSPTLKSGSTGYELMDNQSSFGMTDEEFKIKKKRMLEGEIEKTIKSLDPIDNAKVSLTEATDSIFVKESTPGTASVTLKIKEGNTLNDEQVQSIVALVSSSAKNIPKENVSVVDQNMKWLTKDLNSDETEEVSSETISKQQKAQNDYEEKLQSAIVELLEPIVGKNKIKAHVNVKLDFDSKQKTQTTVDPNKVIVSQQTIKEVNKDGNLDNTTTESPVDNNMSNEITDENLNSTSTRDEQKTNYDTGKSETKVISAQGEVKRLTASVVIDKALTPEEVMTLQDVVSNAIGLDELKGDKVSVVGMEFDKTEKENAKALVDQMNQEEEANKKNLMMIAGGVLGALIIGLLTVFVIKKRKKKKEEEEQLLDTLIDDTIVPKEPDSFDPIEFEVKTKKSHLENEIKKYATEKPDQVVEIIKSWLTEDEG